MPWKAHVLVVANRTADSDELRDALCERAGRGSARFTLVVPATPPGPGDAAGGREVARGQLERALERLRDAGLEAEGAVGDCDPVAAIADVWDPAEFDDIVVSTLPTGTSRWLAADLPRRIARLTGATVAHVVARERERERERGPALEAPPAEPRGANWAAPFRTAPREPAGRERRR
jgi:hypothetical protein